MFLSRKMKNIDTFWLKKAPYQELLLFYILLGLGASEVNTTKCISVLNYCLFTSSGTWFTIS